jgi:rod shape determining protein RodA
MNTPIFLQMKKAHIFQRRKRKDREHQISWKNFDFLLVLSVFALVGFGLLTILNATGGVFLDEGESITTVLDGIDWTYTRLQAMWFAIGCVMCAIVVALDYKIFYKLSELIYWGAVALLAFVLVVGKVAGGTQGWYKITENRSFQPSEIAKLALIISLAKQLSKYPKGVQRWLDLLWVLIRVGIPLALILLQPDLGTALVYLFITLVVLFASGIRPLLMGTLVAGGVGAVIPVWKYLLTSNQKKRLLVFLDEANIDPQGAGYNVRKSKMAVGSGQMMGKGMFSPGAMSQLEYIPAQHTDFIFSVAAETFGFVGATAIIALYALMIFRMLHLARSTKDRFGSYMVLGVMAMMMFHILENIGMCMGIMPVTGIPLPFMSYGGSAMLTNMIAIGICLNVGLRRRKEKSVFIDKEDDD